jgi:hypothetical protein
VDDRDDGGATPPGEAPRVGGGAQAAGVDARDHQRVPVAHEPPRERAARRRRLDPLDARVRGADVGLEVAQLRVPGEEDVHDDVQPRERAHLLDEDALGAAEPEVRVDERDAARRRAHPRGPVIPGSPCAPRSTWRPARPSA